MKPNFPLCTLALCILSLPHTSWSLPFAPFDARSMAMGGTGVASAELAASTHFNPALLAAQHDGDDISIIIPQVGINLLDEDSLIDSVEDYDDANYFTRFSDDLSNLDSNISQITNAINRLSALETSDPNNLQLSELQAATEDLNQDLNTLNNTTTQLSTDTQELTSAINDLSGKALQGIAGIGSTIVRTNEHFAIGVNANITVAFAGRLQVASNDTDLANNYAAGTNAFATTAAAYGEAVSRFSTAATAVEEAINNNASDEVRNAAVAELEAADIALDTAEQAVKTFNYGGQEGEGNVAIFNNGQVLDTDPTLESSGHSVAIAISEIGFPIASHFDHGKQRIAVGVTPKLQAVNVYDYIYRLSDDDFEIEDITDNERSYTNFNVDVGLSTDFGDEKQWRTGLVLRNLLAQEYETALGDKIEINTQARVGVAYRKPKYQLATDLDLTKNEPIAFSKGTRYLGLGAEYKVGKALQLRAGYRTNLEGEGKSQATAGIGLDLFGLHTDLSAQLGEDQFGALIQTGLHF